MDNHNRPFAVELAIPVRGYDIDYGGVVSNIVYVRWLEDLRSELIFKHISRADQVEQGFAAVVASTFIKYRRPIRLLDKPTGKMWMSDLGKMRWTVEAEIELDGQIVTTAVQTGAFVSLATMRPVTPPDELVASFAKAKG